MYSFKETLNRIENEVSQLRFSRHPQSLYAPIEYILEIGGKRIRPALTLLACNLFDEDVDKAIRPALGIEVFHNFTLLHDDLMDQADKRRNRPTVHKVWNANTAILSGDAMLIYAYQLIAEAPSKNLSEVINLFSKTALEICEGQQLDMEFETRDDVQ
jgi:geranylgeranyl diphosphate synthase type II